MPTKNKIARLEGVSAMIEAGQVLFPHSASWLQVYLDELCGFPGGRYDDQVDSTSQALTWLRENASPGGIYEYYRHELNTIRLDGPQQSDVHKATAEIEGEITNGAVVAELSLGFWAALLNTSNDNEVWRKALYLAFPNRPKGTERKAVHGAINSIRRLRNRIAHHEKILHRDLQADHDTIIEIAGWICPDTRDWIAEMSQFDPSELPSCDEQLPFPEEPAQPENHTPAPEPRETLNGRPRLSIRRDQ